MLPLVVEKINIVSAEAASFEKAGAPDIEQQGFQFGKSRPYPKIRVEQRGAERFGIQRGQGMHLAGAFAREHAGKQFRYVLSKGVTAFQAFTYTVYAAHGANLGFYAELSPT